MLATQGLFKEAWETILRENPFPSVCGRVCFHPCEASATGGSSIRPLPFHSLERFLADTAIRYGIKPDLEEKVIAEAEDCRDRRRSGGTLGGVVSFHAGLCLSMFLRPRRKRVGYCAGDSPVSPPSERAPP